MFAGLAVGWVLLRFISNATPLVRDAIFTLRLAASCGPARRKRRSAMRLALRSLSFHQGKQTGAVARVIDRGARSADALIGGVVFNLGPTVFELVMASYIMTTRYFGLLAVVTVVTILLYIFSTLSISNWRLRYRRAVNDADNMAAGLAVDALMNFETVIKAFGLGRPARSAAIAAR